MTWSKSWRKSSGNAKDAAIHGSYSSLEDGDADWSPCNMFRDHLIDSLQSTFDLLVTSFASRQVDPVLMNFLAIPPKCTAYKWKSVPVFSNTWNLKTRDKWGPNWVCVFLVLQKPEHQKGGQMRTQLGLLSRLPNLKQRKTRDTWGPNWAQFVFSKTWKKQNGTNEDPIRSVSLCSPKTETPIKWVTNEDPIGSVLLIFPKPETKKPGTYEDPIGPNWVSGFWFLQNLKQQKNGTNEEWIGSVCDTKEVFRVQLQTELSPEALECGKPLNQFREYRLFLKP